jgi:hypothetical protein
MAWLCHCQTLSVTPATVATSNVKVPLHIMSKNIFVVVLFVGAFLFLCRDGCVSIRGTSNRFVNATITYNHRNDNRNQYNSADDTNNYTHNGSADYTWAI